MSTPPISKYPDMGEVTGLRLELGRMTDKANALEAALRKEVMAVIKDALADNSRIIAENYRLKADVESLVSAGEDLAHAVRSKHGVDFAMEEWAKVANTEGGKPSV